MTRMYTIGGAALLGMVVLAQGAGGCAARTGRPVASPPYDGSILSMQRFASGPFDRVGDFSGTLLCARCDAHGGFSALARCADDTRCHVLAIDGSGLHPLLAATPAAHSALDAVAPGHGTVTVHGLYNPATGAILVDRIANAQSRRPDGQF